ncbi:BatD family protein [Thiohalophilus thiocyanatoxydans]|uniref:Oxygen tolerance protein BatD n=1 Tax=Thiohalophilus thiocyanatoxydans TaxID=381308 RepID=A0A4R8IPH7_9GAMM|nr:BatD family protein [Thiohalophilus thiocyanatoxydans]TDY02816.1 oxygen tolerance protein BatD [Thiohalophilus thiocyanatoxydans]
MVARIGRPLSLRRLFILLAALSTAHAASATDSGLTVSVDRHTVEYGKSVVLTVRSTEPDTDPGAISLAALEPDFAIEPIRGRSATETDTPMRQWRLYPRRPGELIIPAPDNAARRDPVRLNVTPAVDPRDGQPIRVTREISGTDVWLRQAVHLTMTLETASPIIILERETPAHDALAIHELATTERPVDPQQQRYRHTTGWVAHPLRQGEQRLQLPPLRYVRDGVTTHRFYPPVLQLAVRPLPPYLSPQMPIGTLSLQIDRPDRFVFTDELHDLKVTLQGRGIRRQDMPQLERQLASSADITLYPAQQAYQQKTDAGRLIGQSDYAIPFSIKQSGRITLPDLRLDYFDPNTGRIVSRQVAGQAVYAMNRWLFYLLIGIGLVVLGISIRKSLPPLTRHLRRLKGYTRVIGLLPMADSDERVVQLLREVALGEGWPANLTLAQWLQYWQNHYRPDTRLDRAIEALILKRYAGEPLDIRQVREQLRAALSRQHAIPGWLGRLTPVNE